MLSRTIRRRIQTRPSGKQKNKNCLLKGPPFLSDNIDMDERLRECVSEWRDQLDVIGNEMSRRAEHQEDDELTLWAMMVCGIGAEMDTLVEASNIQKARADVRFAVKQNDLGGDTTALYRQLRIDIGRGAVPIELTRPGGRVYVISNEEELAAALGV